MQVFDTTVAHVFLDIETTGLNPETDRILEVGVATANEHLQIIDSRNWLVVERGWKAALARNPYVWDMHRKSGLLAELMEIHELLGTPDAVLYTEDSVSVSIATWLYERVEPSKFPMSGSSIHFDRAFLMHDMKAVIDVFSHRLVDVSTIKELVKVWYPEIAAEREKTRPKSEAKHRALDDIEDSIEELKFYRSQVFIP